MKHERILSIVYRSGESFSDLHACLIRIPEMAGLRLREQRWFTRMGKPTGGDQEITEFFVRQGVSEGDAAALVAELEFPEQTRQLEQIYTVEVGSEVGARFTLQLSPRNNVPVISWEILEYRCILVAGGFLTIEAESQFADQFNEMVNAMLSFSKRGNCGNPLFIWRQSEAHCVRLRNAKEGNASLFTEYFLS